MICRLSLLSVSTFWDSYYYDRIGFFQGISISYRSNIFESLLLYSVSCTNCEVFDKKIADLVLTDLLCYARIAAKHLDADLISAVLMEMLKRKSKDEAMAAVC